MTSATTVTAAAEADQLAVLSYTDGMSAVSD